MLSIPCFRFASPGRRAAPVVVSGLTAVCLALSPMAGGAAPQAGATSGAYTGSLPALGDAAAQTLSPVAERRLGDRIMRSILRDPDVVDDPLVLEYVTEVWQALLAGARQRGDLGAELENTYAWRPFLVKDRSVNAFALPGGYIGVHLGLLAMTTTTDELASVLAHELSHVTQRHIARMIGEQQRHSWVSIASMILGAMAISRSPQAAQALITGGQAVALQGQLNFSRDMEREADRVGYGVMNEAGFATRGMAEMFEHLQQASRLVDDGSFPYLRTHPLTSERIGEARSRMGLDAFQDVRAQQDPDHLALAARHALLAARARVLMDTRSAGLTPLAHSVPGKDANGLQAVATYYMAAVASRRLDDRSRALQTLKQARASAAALPAAQAGAVERLLLLEEADVQLEGRQAGAASAVLAGAVSAHQIASGLDARPELLLSARVALALPEGRDGQQALADAANRLQTHVSAHPEDAAAWTLLSSCWERLNQPLRAIRAEAESVAALGDLPGAIDRLSAAVRNRKRPSPADAIELSVMQSRLRAWQRQQREDMAEEAK